jgi:ubiquitin-protein ligase
MSALRRLRQDLRGWPADQPKPEIFQNANSQSTEAFLLRFTLLGPPATPYENIPFVVQLMLSSDYPSRAPVAQFLTPILHPAVNVEPPYLICPQSLSWKPTHTLAQFWAQIPHLLTTLESPSPLNVPLAALLTTNPTLALTQIRTAALAAKDFSIALTTH